jgi:hypothetical protein
MDIKLQECFTASTPFSAFNDNSELSDFFDNENQENASAEEDGHGLEIVEEDDEPVPFNLGLKKDLRKWTSEMVKGIKDSLTMADEYKVRFHEKSTNSKNCTENFSKKCFRYIFQMTHYIYMTN